MSKIKRMIKRELLPKKGSYIDWKQSVGIDIPFEYDDIQGTVKIKKVLPNKQLIIEYNGLEYDFSEASFLKCCFGKILSKFHYDWRYQIGEQIIIDDSIKGEIVNRVLRSDSQGYNNRFYEIKCSTCGKTHFIREDKAMSLWVCPGCSGNVLYKGENDLWTTNPEIANQLYNAEDGYKVKLHSNEKLDWVCPICHGIVRGLTPWLVYHAVNRIVPCPICGDGFSYPNKFMYNLLNQCSVDFVNEASFQWEGLGKRRYDFYLPQQNTIIEMNGLFHYRSNDIRNNDCEKRKIAFQNGIKHYVEIDSSRTDAQYIFNNILNSEIKEFIDLSCVDIGVIDSLARQSMFKKILDELESTDYDIELTANNLRIHKATVYSYIKKAINNGILDKDFVLNIRYTKRESKYHQNKGIPYMRIDTMEAYGNRMLVRKYFPKYSDTDLNNIYCKHTSVTKGIPWRRMDRKEFNEYKRNNPDKVYGDYFIKEAV